MSSLMSYPHIGQPPKNAKGGGCKNSALLVNYIVYGQKDLSTKQGEED